MKFKKRTYNNIKEFFSDLSFPFRNRSKLKILKNENILPSSFKERLMLAVTSVNNCRYCSYFHSRQALESGIDSEEITKLLSGDFNNCPADEMPAILYAQHWAESNAYPDPEAAKKLHDIYGPEKSDAIHTVLRMIRMGNLMGNSWDYFLYRISFGKFNR